MKKYDITYHFFNSSDQLTRNEDGQIIKVRNFFKFANDDVVAFVVDDCAVATGIFTANLNFGTELSLSSLSSLLSFLTEVLVKVIALLTVEEVFVLFVCGFKYLSLQTLIEQIVCIDLPNPIPSAIKQQKFFDVAKTMPSF